MNFSLQQTDDSILEEIGTRLSAARLARNLTQADLARDAGISKRTLERLEAGESAQLTSFIRLLRALDLIEGLGALLPAARPGPIELLEAGGKPRQRASGDEVSGEPWSWGDDGGRGDGGGPSATDRGDA